MCMKNINATMEMYASVVNKDGIMSFNMPFTTMHADVKDNKAYIENFSIVVSTNLLGTTKENEKVTNIVEQKGKLFCLLRLTKISSKKENSTSWDIENFVINTDDTNIRFEEACVPSVNYKRIINVNRIALDDDFRGNYALKFLVKKDEKDPWNVQSILRLTVI